MEKAIKYLFLLILLWGGAVSAQQGTPSGKFVFEVADPFNIVYVNDRNEGGFIYWQDSVQKRSVIKFQTFNRNNQYLLGSEGAYISSIEEEQVNPVPFAHLAGASIVLWENTDPLSQSFLFAQRVSLKGKKMWQEEGVQLTDLFVQVDEYSGVAEADGKVYAVFLESSEMDGGRLSGIRLNRISSSGYLETPINGVNIYKSGFPLRQLSVALNENNKLMITWLETSARGEVLKGIIYDPEKEEAVTPAPIMLSHATQRVFTHKLVAAKEYFYVCWQTLGKTKNLYQEVISEYGRELLSTPLEEAVKTPGSNLNPQIITTTTGEVVLSWLHETKNNVNLLLSRISFSGATIKNEYINVFGLKENSWRFGHALYQGFNGEVILSWFEGDKGNHETRLYVQKFSKTLAPLLSGGAVVVSPLARDMSYIWFFPDASDGVLAVYKEKSFSGSFIAAKYVKGNGRNTAAVTDVKVEAVGDSVHISWLLFNEAEVTLMKVQRFSAPEETEGWLDLAHFTPQSFGVEQTYTYSYMPYVFGKVDYRVVITTKADEVITSGAVSTQVTPILTSDIKLFQNTPNPFSTETVIPFYLSEPMEVKVEIYNSRIERVRLFEITDAEEGLNKIEFKADDLPSGVYFYRFTAGDYKEVKKMVLSRQ